MTELEQAYDALKCSVSGKGPLDGAAIGFGIDVSQTPKGKEIKTDLYPLSYTAFYEGNVRSTPGGAKITHWLPFAITAEHWARVAATAQQAMSFISFNDYTRFHPGLVFEVVGEMWKTKAVELMKNEEHASEKVLLGFVAFHHLLLACVQSFPNLIQRASDIVRGFVSDERSRNKQAVPDFGRFLPLLLISDIQWTGTTPCASKSCVEELFNRNVLWILKDHPDLETMRGSPARIAPSWENSQVGLKLTCFQVRYLLDVGRPPASPGVADAWGRLNALAGRPTAAMTTAFQQTVKRVQQLSSYPAWFAAMGMPVPTEPELVQMLESAVYNSARLGYHGRGGGGGGGGGGRGRGRGRGR
eukprot:TRINITY_DN4948_c0_g1_i1.p1 TRINITY_DN4948_c0_g1~~TRINITY_DN4948_c0_g1_i1.p1  ORF type:complete len:399 (+),score=78.60 TRINITY_DN4948_c0_g1_i1:126-1199(+)